MPLDGFLDERTFVAFSGTKLGAPASVGVLRAPRRLLDDARPRRRALEVAPPPWLAAVGLGAACAARREQRAAHLAAARRRADELLDGLKQLDPDVRVNGAGAARLGTIVDVSFPRVEALGLVVQLGLEGVAVSHTAACQARVREWSPVVRAAYPDEAERAVGAVRFSVSEHVVADDVARALAILAPLLVRLRTEPLQPAPAPTAPLAEWSPWGADHET